ncbi:hypothetical protein KKG46_03525 [Patescibacteria group bacterium]|nr:hypothetical protein [Patescibacteria group bacterium]
MQQLLKSLLLGTGFFLIIVIVHIFFSYFIKDTHIIKMLRPIRDALFFPVFIVADNTSKLYCKLGEFGITDYNRCLVPVGSHIPLPDGPTRSFRNVMDFASLLAGIIYYSIIFKLLLYFRNKYKTKNSKSVNN